ncbi:zinc finger CCHC domain-containing protein 24-like [Anopheles coustani]|uniref:zinc finger CCHC domain-containing protein 24-like n=1 Tax=Anopheles coustani TaxID=139045 RepID=UPI002658B125|nr:zinc finger CCHC domain-containing protein 24-like [Anopheles coustani]
MSQPEGKALTPYQGNRRSFGAFKCDGCNRSWFSGNSWANFGQQCESCLAYVYPHKQWRLKKRKKSNDANKAHPVDLCGKCKSLGRSCRKIVTKES